jgi:uncharacterized protein YbaA (DUF1428 family)
MAKRKQKATYVDGFVLVVPKRKVAAYRKMASRASKVWMKYGALEYKECVVDDLKPGMGSAPPAMTFSKMARLKAGETVVFSYVTYRSRAHRDAVNKKVMSDPLMNENPDKPMPFDMKRMAYAGFKVIVSA